MTTTPATTDALRRLAQPMSGALRGVHARHALLALAALADHDLNAPTGLGHVTSQRIAVVVGLAPSTMTRTLRGLASAGLATIVISYAATTRHVTGADADRPLPRGARILGFRPTEEVYR